MEKKVKKNNRTANFNLIEVIVIILITSIVIATATSIIVYRNYNELKYTVDNEKATNLEEIEEVYNEILNDYVEKVDEKELAKAAIKGMYSVLGDPNTSYLDESTTSDLMDRLSGEYYGLGIEFTKVDEGFVVVRVFEGSPAEKVGILAGDIISKVNDTELTSEMTSEDVASMIKGSKTNHIKISVKRANITFNKEVDLTNVQIPSVSKDLYDGVGYIKISTFSNTTASQFKSALESLEKQDINGLVIDVRGNGGGYLTAATSISELFLEKGKTIYGLKDQNGKTTYYKDKTSEKRNYKVSIIIDGASASASEILAAALRDSYGATLVGSKSYGKGTVQDTSQLKSGGMIKYTTAYWLTPNEDNIDGKGITPEIEVNTNYTEGTPLENDETFMQAYKVVK